MFLFSLELLSKLFFQVARRPVGNIVKRPNGFAATLRTQEILGDLLFEPREPLLSVVVGVPSGDVALDRIDRASKETTQV